MRQEEEMLLRGVGDHLLRAGGRLVGEKKPEEVPLGVRAPSHSYFPNGKGRGSLYTKARRACVLDRASAHRWIIWLLAR